MKMFEEHIVYEMRMLRATYLILEISGLGLVLNTPVLNALIESFVIHARLLIEFFECQTSIAEEQVCAVHFTDGYTPFQRDHVPGPLIGKLHAQIAHLSYNRTQQEARKIGPADRDNCSEFLRMKLRPSVTH